MPQLWRIIVVEDDPIIAIGLQDMLESIGCEVAARASSVLSALRLLQRLPLLAKPCDIAALKRVFLPLLRHRE